MNTIVPVLKDETDEQPIPSSWRNTFSEIVEAFRQGNFGLEGVAGGIRPISPEDATRIKGNIVEYGAQLTCLPEATWQTSVCQWMRGYWDVLVDLYTVEEGSSDLVLSVRVYEDGPTYSFEVESVYVP